MKPCAICRKSIPDAERVTMGALGRPLFDVHQHPCAGYVRAGVTLTSMLAFKGAHMLLATKAPKVLAVIEKVNQLRTVNPQG